MEYLMQIAEAFDQQSNKQEEEGNRFKSVYTINGKSILAPLMTPERRLEMQKFRSAAMAIEERMRRRAESSSETKMAMLKPRHVGAVGGCCSLVDVSTNTEPEPELVQQPLTVVGRIKQQLQQSETLIYDNKCNAIIKFVKSSKLPAKQHLVCEEQSQIRTQQAVLIEPNPQYGSMSITTLEPLPKQVRSPGCMPLQLQEETDPDPDSAEQMSPGEKSPPKMQTMRQLLGIANMLNLSINRQERDMLHRAITSPALRPRAIMDRNERLHPQLWKRHRSYQLSHNLEFQQKQAAPAAAAEAGKSPSSPNAARVATDVSVSSVALSPSKMQEKQQHSTPNQRCSKAVPSTIPKRSSSSKAAKRTPRARSNVSYTAHASSHANAVQQGASDSSTRISSTQRRLSYDPRATIKRAAALRKVESSSSCGTLSTTKTSPSSSSVTQTAEATAAPVADANADAECSTAELIKRKLLASMEQQQRQRLQQLVAQQAQEQQRLQAEFEAQQQELIEQMICDMSTLTYDKDGQSDQANSETSSISSLPQSRLEHELDEPETTDL